MRRTLRTFIAILGFVLIAAVSEATTIVYTDRDSFNAAVGGTELVTFESTVCHDLFHLGLPASFCQADYGLISVLYDAGPFAGTILPPHISFGGANFVGVNVTQPFTAIGFDVTPVQSEVRFRIVGVGFEPFQDFFTFTQPSFIGFASTDGGPLGFGIDNFYCAPPFPSGATSGFPCQFRIDNAALKVPDGGSTSIYLLFALCALIVVTGRWGHNPAARSLQYFRTE